MEALEELHPRAARGQDLLRNWLDLYVTSQEQGAPEKEPASVGKWGRRGESGKQQLKQLNFTPCSNLKKDDQRKTRILERSVQLNRSNDLIAVRFY